MIMKPTVIQLETYDDVDSIRDTLSFHPRERIILVWPKRGRLLANETELTLIQRAAQSASCALGLVTHHPAIREWAEAADVPVFASITAAKESQGIKPIIKKPVEKKSKGIKALQLEKERLTEHLGPKTSTKNQRRVAILLSLISAGALLFFLIPTAQITYYPEITTQASEITILASEELSGVNLSGGIPAETVFTELSGELALASSGKTNLPTSKATGQVTFTNLTESPITLPHGTLILTAIEEGVAFLLLEKVEVPGGIGEIASGNVEAVQGGEEYNLQAQSALTLAGELEAQLDVTNDVDFSGGSSLEASSPSESDYESARTQLIEVLLEQGLTKMDQELSDGRVLIEESLILDEVMAEEQVNPIGEPADEALIRMTVRLKGLIYREDDILAIAALILNGNQLAGHQLLDEAITLQPIGQVEFNNTGEATWQVSVSRNLVPAWDEIAAAQELSGMKVDEAEQFFSGLFPQTVPAVIKLFFKGWPWMPFLGTQIHFINGASS